MRLASLLAVASLAFAVTAGCVGTAVDVPIEPVPAPRDMLSTTGMTTAQRLVVRDETTWFQVWTQLAGSFRPSPTPPDIDFTRDAVIVAATGTRSNGAFSITVDDARLYTHDAEITVTEHAPGSNCTVPDVVITPAAVVRVPTFSGQATFLEHLSVESCP
jgi:hypothetical protein